MPLKPGFADLIEKATESAGKSQFLFTSWEYPASERGIRPKCYPIGGIDEAAARQLLRKSGLTEHDNELKKAIELSGGHPLALILLVQLVKEGAEVIVTDVNSEILHSVGKDFNVKTVRPEEIYAVECEIFSPNACGGILTQENIKKLNCKMVVGAANNPLAEDLRSVMQMKKRGIIYAPDYVINIGGVFLSMCEVQGKTFEYVIEKLGEIIHQRLQQIIKEAEKNSETLFEAAERIVSQEASRT